MAQFRSHSLQWHWAKPGDEVIIPNYTMFATYSSMKMLGLNVKLVDVERSSLCIDINLLEENITDATRCVVLVSANGRYPGYPIQDLLDLCDRYGLF